MRAAAGRAWAGVGDVKADRWGLLLAGGDGVRLRSLTRAVSGDDRPKQFCPVMGGLTLLEQTWRRAALAVPREQTMVVVTRSHERFYRPALSAIPIPHVVIQPENRGTAPGILYPLLRLATLAPDASVAVFPSDHHFSDDALFVEHVDQAFRAVAADPSRILLLGIIPDTHETEYGWIELGERLSGVDGRPFHQVSRFWEKPDAALAEILRERGCLWNSFVMVGRVEAFLGMIRHAAPDLYNAFAAVAPALGGPGKTDAVRALYSRLAVSDFSREILTESPGRLGVMPVLGVTWSDLGSPERVMRARRMEPAHPQLVYA